MGMWYGSTEKYTAIQNACDSTGCTFIDIGVLSNSSTRNAIGNLTAKGSDTRTLSDVNNVVENTPTNITVGFTVGGVTYSSTLDVVSYSLSTTVLTYDSDYEIISSGGVASHPSDEGFRQIANKFIYSAGLTTSTEYYL